VANRRCESWDYHFEQMLVKNGYRVERCVFLEHSVLRPQVVRQRLRYFIRAPDGRLLPLYIVLVIRVEPFSVETYSIERAEIEQP
jgi:hypothetical protein